MDNFLLWNINNISLSTFFNLLKKVDKDILLLSQTKNKKNYDN